MIRQACVFALALIFYGAANLAIPVVGYSEEAIQRMVRGTVVAANVDVDPQTIVVSVMLPNEQELIVGARVMPNTRIARGKQTVRLRDVKTGERIELAYLKTPDGLIARSIHVR